MPRERGQRDLDVQDLRNIYMRNPDAARELAHEHVAHLERVLKELPRGSSEYDWDTERAGLKARLARIRAFIDTLAE